MDRAPSKRKRKRFKIRLQNGPRLRAICKFKVACSLHPKGEHDVVAYGYPLRKTPGHVREWNLTHPPPFYGKRSHPAHVKGASARKYIAIKFLDFKWCARNTKADRKLHKAAHLLGAPSCRYAMYHTIATTWRHRQFHLERRPLLQRPTRWQDIAAFFKMLCIRYLEMRPDWLPYIGVDEQSQLLQFRTTSASNGPAQRIDLKMGDNHILFPGTKITYDAAAKYLLHFWRYANKDLK